MVALEQPEPDRRARCFRAPVRERDAPFEDWGR